MQRSLSFVDRQGTETSFFLDTDTDMVEIVHGLDRRNKDIETLEAISSKALSLFATFRESSERHMHFMEEPSPTR